MFVLSVILFYFCFASKYYGFSFISIIKRFVKLFNRVKKAPEASAPEASAHDVSNEVKN